jgi:hypothetical protein
MWQVKHSALPPVPTLTKPLPLKVATVNLL